MEIIADLHLHSQYALAVSKEMTIRNIAKWAGIKGIDLIGTGDFLHPKRIEEIKEELEETGEGFLKLKGEKGKMGKEGKRRKRGRVEDPSTSLGMTTKELRIMEKEVRFVLSTEVSSVYKLNGKVRRIHNLIIVPSINVAQKIVKAFEERRVNLRSDGRPIMGLSAHDITEMVLGISEKALIIPCHIWTPHFGLYGSKSGFDSIAECFWDLAPFIYAIETGISSDPEMNWRIKDLDHRSIVSFSDAHSLWKIGREATVFQTEIPNSKYQIPNKKNIFIYDDLYKAIRQDKDGGWKIGGTVEFYPEEGMYHFSGHRKCDYSTGGREEICPKCGKKLTEGVMKRVESLAGRTTFAKATAGKGGVLGIRSKVFPERPGFVKLIPLNEILGEVFGVGVASKKVKEFYFKMTDWASELEILLKKPIRDINNMFGGKIAEGIEKVRMGKVKIEAGYDGRYGKVRI